MAEPQKTKTDSKRLDRPNKEAHDKEMQVLDDKIKEQKAIVERVKTKLDKMKEDKEKNAGEKKANPEQEKLEALRTVTKRISTERKVDVEQVQKLKTLRDSARTQFDDMRKRMRDLNCNSTADVDKKIKYVSTFPLLMLLNIKFFSPALFF
jgi:chromosome segregation ATPase